VSARWKSLAVPQINGVPEAIESVASAVDVLAGLLDVLSELIDTLAALMSAYIDPVQLAMQALIAVLSELRDQLLALMSGLIWFYMDPGPLHANAEPDGLAGFLDRWARSFDDAGDKERPVLPESTQVSAMFIVVGADTLGAFKEFLVKLGELLYLPDLELAELESETSLQQSLEATMSTPPDWRQVTIGTVLVPFKRLAEMLDKCVQVLLPAEAYADVLAQLAFIIQEKALAMADLAAQLQGLADALEAIMASTGLHSLVVDAIGIPALIAAANDAEAPPPFAPDAYVGGVCFFAATPDFAPLITLLGEGVDD